MSRDPIKMHVLPQGPNSRQIPSSFPRRDASESANGHLSRSHTLTLLATWYHSEKNTICCSQVAMVCPSLFLPQSCSEKNLGCSGTKRMKKSILRSGLLPPYSCPSTEAQQTGEGRRKGSVKLKEDKGLNCINRAEEFMPKNTK